MNKGIYYFYPYAAILGTEKCHKIEAASAEEAAIELSKCVQKEMGGDIVLYYDSMQTPDAPHVSIKLRVAHVIKRAEYFDPETKKYAEASDNE